MKRHAIRLLFVAVAFVAVSTPAFGQMGIIRGTITDAAGNPLKDVEVEIMDLGIARTFKTKSDGSGKYVHAGVPLNGLYRVVIRHEGFQSDYVENVRPAVSMNDKERGAADFVLKPGPAGKMSWELTDEERARIIAENAEIEARRAELEASAASFEGAIASYEAGNYQEALDGFLATAEIRGDEAVVWANAGNAYLKLGQPEKALESYNKAILLDDTEAAYYQNRGGIYGELGDAAAAQADYDKAASMTSELDPKAAAVNYYNMGVTYINNNQLKEALGALTKALELDPNNGEAQYQKAICLLGLGDLEAATTELKRYLEIAPDGPHADDSKAMLEQLGGM